VLAGNAGRRCQKGLLPPGPFGKPRQTRFVAALATASKHSPRHGRAITSTHPPHESLNVTPTMATLAANDQENAVRHLQAGAAGKSLNAGIKGFNAKTPGHKAPKTPFKIPLNDENAVNVAGKSGLQTKVKGNDVFATKKGGKNDENAFMTPAGTT